MLLQFKKEDKSKQKRESIERGKYFVFMKEKGDRESIKMNYALMLAYNNASANGHSIQVCSTLDIKEMSEDNQIDKLWKIFIKNSSGVVFIPKQKEGIITKTLRDMCDAKKIKHMVAKNPQDLKSENMDVFFK